MNKKASKSAMSNKIFLGFWFVLFATLVLVINWLFRMPVHNADELVLRLSATKSQLADLKAIHVNFLLNYNQADNLFSNADDKVESDARSTITAIRRDLTYCKTRYSLARKKEVSASIESFSNALSAFENGLNDFFLISHERGNLKSGLISQWLGLSRSILDATSQNKGDQTAIMFQIKDLENQYLLTRDIRTLKNISVLAEEIRNLITYEESAVSYEDIDRYASLTGNLVSIEKRMGYEGAPGIIAGMQQSIQKLQDDFQKTNDLIIYKADRGRTWWTTARYFFIMLIVALYIYLFISVFSIVDPLKQLAGFAQKIARGEFPDDAVSCGNLSDMQDIKNSLDEHVVSLRNKYAFTSAMNQDILDTTLDLQGENDDLGHELIRLQKKISDTAEKQARNEEDNLKRRYMNEGLARFAEILRTKSNDLNLLGDNFIREIVKYLNAIQGGFFIFEDSDTSTPALNLIAAFAYNRKKYMNKSISVGEGLVGTCAKEKKTINLVEIPAGYITITSGLGDTPPDNLLLVPVMHEDELLGVIEIASLNRFKDYEVDFAEQVAQTLGSTIDYTRNNQKTADLLARSQQQALEMAEQEEEMRQNMEELKATQEESGRREEEFRGIVEAMGNSMYIVEYDLEGKISHGNEKLCVLLGTTQDELIGKLHQDVFNGTLKTDTRFWEDVLKNKHVNVHETIRIGKKEIGILENFTPVVNREGITVKYINFATDGRIGNS
ncbi:MAG: GAF domain-containing protein [Bacteroidales bacterium]|nr:GAF domain-containing protein [Bacteroidales bacterium]